MTRGVGADNLYEEATILRLDMPFGNIPGGDHARICQEKNGCYLKSPIFTPQQDAALLVQPKSDG